MGFFQDVSLLSLVGSSGSVAFLSIHIRIYHGNIECVSRCVCVGGESLRVSE
jgi:hypothetical protein